MNLTKLSEIKQLLGRHGFRFSKSMGQNFLVEAWVPERIADSVGLSEACAVLEIGPGIGCLTERLSDRAGRVVAIELDRALEPVLCETLADCDNVEIVFGDVLKQSIPQIIEEKFSGLTPYACANLPYNITTPVLTALLEAQAFVSVTVMIQREVAKRICAEPGTSDYGAFTVFCNWYAMPEILFDVPPTCFIPQPKVTSSVIRLTRHKSPPADVSDEKKLFRVVRAAFGQRRKTLANALSAGLGLPKSQVAEAIEAMGLGANVRGETLGLGQFAELAQRLK